MFQVLVRLWSFPPYEEEENRNVPRMLVIPAREGKLVPDQDLEINLKFGFSDFIRNNTLLQNNKHCAEAE